MNNIVAVTNNMVDAKATSENSSFISSSSRKPAITAGMVAIRSNNIYLIEESLFSGLPNPENMVHTSLNVNNKTAKMLQDAIQQKTPP
jgi:SLT domain-containing protein